MGFENGVADLSDPMLKDRSGELKAPSRHSPGRRMRSDSDGYRRDHLRALIQRVVLEFS
jgi:hypothetical protein